MNSAHRLRADNDVVVRQSVLTGGTAAVAVATGLLLDVVAAAAFGAGRDTDAFVVAARFPLALTAIFMLLGNQALVPTMTTWSATLDRRRGRSLVTTTLLASLTLGAAVAAVFSVFGTVLVAVTAPGFHAEQRVLATELLRVMVWTIPLTAGCEVLRAWLNARHLFVVPAAMTVVLNVVAAAIIVLGTGDIGILPVAFLCGSAVQFILMLLYAVRRGLRFAAPAPRDAEAATLVRLLVRPSVGASLNPLVRVAETAVASFLIPGSATVLHYAHRLVSAVGGTMFFRSVMVAVLPRLTRAFATRDRQAVDRLSSLGLRLMVSVSLPLTGLGLVLAVPAAETVFGIGRFGPDDARLLGLVIVVLSLSFPASAVQRSLLLPFYATRETRTPLRNSLAGAVANLVALPLCVLPLLGTGYAVLGVAAAYVVANVVNVVHAWICLRRGDLGMPHVPPRRVARTLTAGLTGAGVAALLWTTGDWLPGGGLLRLAVAGVGGALANFAVELRRSAPGQRARRLVGAESGATSVVGTAAMAVVGAAAVTATSMAFVTDGSTVALVAPVGLIAGGIALALAMARFEAFVLALLVARTSLDALKFGHSGSPLEPAALLGMLFLGAAAVWLATQWVAEGRVRCSPLGWAAICFAGAGLVGVLVAPSYWPALVEWTRLASVCVMVLVAERLGSRPAFRRHLVVAVFAAAVVPLVVASYQTWSGTGLLQIGGFGRARGTFTHPNPLAAFLALLVVLAFAHVVHLRRPGPRAWAVLGLVATAAGLYMTYTRAAWLAALVGVLVVAMTRSRRLVGTVLVTLLLLLALVPGVATRFSDLGDDTTSRGEPSNSLTWRAEYWGEALTLAADSPVTGIGLKQVAARAAEGKQPHNDFLRAYVEMGVFGLAAYLYFTWQLLATAARAVRRTRGTTGPDRALAVGFAGTAAGYVLMCLVANLMSQVVVGLYVMGIAGTGAALASGALMSRSANRPVRQPTRKG